MSVSSTTVSPGAPLTVTVTNGPGNRYDWVALNAMSAADGVYLAWLYLNDSPTPPAGGTAAATLHFTAPMAPGTYNFRFFANNSMAKLATSFTVTVLPPAPPAVTVSAPTVNRGETITVTVARGPANRTDWVGLYSTAASAGGYVSWLYLSDSATPPATGKADATLHFTAPMAPGTYTFRLFVNGSLTQIATSAAVTVLPPPPPTLTVSAPTFSVGDPITVTLANGPGNRYDWIGLFPSTAGDPGYVAWKYLSDTLTAPGSGVSGATLRFSVNTPGTYNFRFFANNSSVKLATSAALTVIVGPTTTVSVPSTPVFPGETITVTVANGPANRTDWAALHPAAADDRGYTAWRYLNDTQTPPAGGTTGATLHFTVPTAGIYNVRLFANDGMTKLATSTPVTVLPPPPPPVPSPPTTARYEVWGGQNFATYLGCFSCPEHASDSVFNEHGPYGSPNEITSVWNPSSEFGSADGAFSACNPRTSTPPRIVNTATLIYEELTVNPHRPYPITDPTTANVLRYIICKQPPVGEPPPAGVAEIRPS